MRPSGTVTLLSDFGLADAYVASMKGALLAIAPGLTLVDITHLVPRHDVVAGALLLASAAGHFPRGTVHLAVVDPGVGSARAAVAVETDRAWLVGPDNGLLVRAVGEAGHRAVRIERVPGRVRPPSPTFHGRDLFAPAAAHLAAGGSLADLGREAAPLEPLPLPPIRIEGGAMIGEVVHVDHFGNAVTSLPAAALTGDPDRLVVEVAGHRIRGLARTYSDGLPGELVALVGSDGALEVAVREGSAAERLGLSRGASVVVHLGGGPPLAPEGEGE